MNEQEIREYAKYLVEERHSRRISEQKTDQEFFEDKYDIPLVKDKKYIIHTGYIAGMANGITQQVIAAKPKVFTQKRRDTKGIEEGADRIAEVGNKWAGVLAKQSNNPFRQTFKNIAFTRGESWIYTPHKEELAMWKGKTSWQEEMPDEIPVHFILYDPMVVFSDPSSYVDGKPTRVVVYYQRLVSDLRASYLWEGKQKDNDLVDFLFYVDKSQFYAEADKRVLFNRKNIYGLVPFAHAYSGYGQETEDKRPELLAFSRIKMLRDRVIEDSTMASDFSYNMHRFAHRHKTLINQTGQEVGVNAFSEYKDAPDAISILTLPPGQAEWKVEESLLFEAPVFEYARRVRGELAGEYPAPLRGIASGTSGRQEDILAGAGISMYASPIQNTALLWANAFDNAFRICHKVPDMLPPTLRKDDINSYSEIEVRVESENPLETLRRREIADREYQSGIIDLQTCLLEGHGRTKSEAKEIMVNQLVDSVTRNDPAFKQLMGIALAREQGVADEYNQLAQREKTLTGTNPPLNVGAEGGQPRAGNIQTPMGQEQVDMSLRTEPPRRSPRMA